MAFLSIPPNGQALPKAVHSTAFGNAVLGHVPLFSSRIRHMEDITIINGTLVICSDGSFYMPNQAMEKWPWIRKYLAECFWNVA